MTHNANQTSRREFLLKMGISAAALPFVLNLPSFGFANTAKRKQRIVGPLDPGRQRQLRKRVRQLLCGSLGVRRLFSGRLPGGCAFSTHSLCLHTGA